MARRGRPGAWACVAAAALVAGSAPVGARGGRFAGGGRADRAFREGVALEAEAEALTTAGRGRQAAAARRDAVARYEEALRADPGLIQAAVKVGYALYQLGQSAKAEAILERALGLAPRDPDLQHVLGLNLFRLGRMDRAIPLLEGVVRADPDQWFGAAFLLGKHFYKAGKLARAAPFLRHYLAHSPLDARARGALGNIYLKQGHLPEAEREFRRLLEIEPESSPGRINLANALYLQGAHEEAAATFEAALKAAPGRVTLHYNLGACYTALGRSAEAIRHYRLFVAARPNHARAHYHLGNALTETGEVEAAIAAYRRSARRDGAHAWTPYRLALALLEQGEADAARDALSRAAALKPGDPWIQSARGVLARRVGDSASAVEIHRRVAETHPGHPRFRGLLAEALIDAGDLDGAIRALDRALAQAPGDPDAVAGMIRARTLRARARLEAGEARGAVGDLDVVVGLAPTSTEARGNLGVALLKADRPKEALGVLTSARADGGDSIPMRLAIFQAHLRLGEVGAADAELATLERASAEAPGVRLARAIISLERGQSDAAVSELEPLARAGKHAEEALPLLARARASRAAKRMATGDDAGAMEDLRALSDLGGALDPETAWWRAYALHRTRRWKEALVALDGEESRRAAALRRAVLGRLLSREIRAGRTKSAAARLAQIRAAGADDEDVALRHDAACVAWLRGRERKAMRTWRALEREHSHREASLALGVAADLRGEHEEAWKRYHRYGAGGGPHAATARKWAAAKARVFGFGKARAR